MSRAVAAVSQGDFVVALGANPFVVFVWPLFVLLAGLALMPKTWVTSIEARLDTVGPQLARGYRVVLFAFLGFGVLRFSWFLIMGQPFP
jgi:hypothetical protein